MNSADKNELARLRARVFELEQRLHDAPEASLLPLPVAVPSFVLDCMSEAVCIADETGTILYTNPAEDKMFGYERGELVGKHLTDQDGLPPHLSGDAVEEILNVLRTSGKWFGERSNRRKDGTPFYTTARIYALEESGQKYWLCMQEDITARRSAEVELRAANEKLNALILASPLPIVAFDREGLIRLWNPAAERVFGWSEEEVLGQSLPFIPEEKRSEHQSMRQRDLSGQGFVNREVTRKRKDGTPIDISVSTAPMYDTSGQITGIMSVYVDVTEQKRDATTQRRALELLLQNEAQLTLLVEASGVLLASPQSAQVLKTILQLAQKFVHAQAYAVWRKTGDVWHLMESTGLSDTYERVIAPNRVDDMQLPEEPLAVVDVYRHPGLAKRAELYRAEGITSILTVPLRVHGEIAGNIVFYYRSPHMFSEAEKRVAGALGNLAASALSAAETYERQAELRAIAEAAERRATFLAAVGEELVSTLEYEVTLSKVAKLSVPEFADWCAVDIVEPDGEIRRLAVQHVDPEKIEFAYEYARRYPPRPDDLPSTAIKTGQAVIVPDIPDAVLAQSTRDEEHLEAIRSLGIRSVICAPMVVRGRTLGLLTFVVSDTSRRFTSQDLSMAIEIARRAAVAVDNARLFREVRENEERFRRLYESNILAVAFWNSDGVITAANDAYLQILAIPKSEFERTGTLHWSDVTPDDHRDTFDEIIRECRDHGATSVHEKEFLRRDGTLATVLIASAFLNNQQKEAVAFLVDITDRKKLDRQFRGVADAAVAISASRSVGDVLRTVNDRVRNLVPCRQSEIRLNTEGVSGSADLAVPLMERSGKLIGTIRLWAYDSSAFTETDRAIVVQLAGMASIAIENNQLNESLRRSNEELQRANEDLNQFAYSASHDLQEPLRMISIYTQLLGRKLGSSSDGDTREYMRFTLDGAQRMEMLIRDLLAYTHAVNIRGIPEGMVDSGMALRKAIANLRGSIESTGADLIIVGTLPSLRAYEIHLVQLFQNLVGNAIKYRGIHPPRIEIDTAYDDVSKRWLFSVKDNGIGIAPRYQQQVFGLFKRLYPAHQYPGTGIGLAICQKVVERYGGRIWVESEEGSGSTFLFTLPA